MRTKRRQYPIQPNQPTAPTGWCRIGLTALIPVVAYLVAYAIFIAACSLLSP
jgi:hypothetical protein